MRIGAWHLDVTDNSTLPSIANYNPPDGVLLGQSGNTSVSFADISDRNAQITAGIAGDLMLLLGRGWVRVGNLFTGGPAVAAVKAIADANAATINKLAVFGQYELNPGGISGSTPPDFIALTLSTKRTPKIITNISVNLGGVIMADIRRNANPVPPAIDDAAPINTPANPYELAGGVINLTFPNERDKLTFANAVMGTVQNRPQFVHGSITYTFADGTSQIDRIHFGVNNNAFDLARNPEFSSDVTTIVKATPGPALVVSNIASYDATQNRFEDSSGDEVVVPDGSIVTLTQAVYDAAVADSDFTPNVKAIFLTR